MDATAGASPLFLVVRSSAAVHAPRALRDAVEAAGVPLAFEPVAGLGALPQAIERAIEAGHSTLIVAGSDAAFSLAADTLVRAGTSGTVALGIVPAGASRDVATSLGITSVTVAVQVALGGVTRPLDAGRATTADSADVTHFVVAAAAGWIPPAPGDVRAALRALPAQTGRMAAAWKRLVKAPTRSFTLSVDGAEMDGRYNAVSVHNLARWQGGLTGAPGASPGDGLLDVIRWEANGRRDVARSLRAQMDGSGHLADGAASRSPGRVVEVSSPHKVTLVADGRPVGQLPARIEVLPGALRVLSPGPSQS